MKETDRTILEYFRNKPDARIMDAAADTGIKTATIRNIISRLRRADLMPAPSSAIKSITVSVATTTAARVDTDRTTAAVSLPALAFCAAPLLPEKAPHRITTPIPQPDPIEDMKARRLALMKKVHREGQLRGQFRVRSR